MSRTQQGFTLMEILVVVAIVAILAALGYPSYMASVRKTNRSDGMAVLMETAQVLERCHTTYGQYDNVNCRIQPGDKILSSHQHYEVTIAADESSFILTAAPASDAQKQDTACGDLSLTHTGRKSASGTQPDRCW